MDNSAVVNIAITHTGESGTDTFCDFHRGASRLHSVTDHAHAEEVVAAASARRYNHLNKGKTHPDMRRPPPGGRAGVVSTADSGGEEPDRVSTVANDP